MIPDEVNTDYAETASYYGENTGLAISTSDSYNPHLYERINFVTQYILKVYGTNEKTANELADEALIVFNKIVKN